MVMKYVDGLDAFVKFRIYSRDAIHNLLLEARITDRRSYVNLVIETCVAQLPSQVKSELEIGGERREVLRETLFEMCVSLNPDLDIHKVLLPVIEELPEISALEPDPANASSKDFCSNDPKRLVESLRRKVIGQDSAVGLVANAMARGYAGLRDPERPVGVFMFLGQTGVGKTELAKALAEELSDGDRKAMVRIDCSEYSLPHEYAKLIGAPPGYVGHEQGGYLTSVMSAANASVVLFDEIEKADEKVHNLLLQIMDEGFVTDAKGTKIDFTESLIILTSNVGADETDALQRRMGFGQSARGPLEHEQRKSASLEALRKRFKPEFINRIDEIVVFQVLGQAEASRILDKFMGQLGERAQERDLHIELSAAARTFLLEKGFSNDFGAREMRRAVQRHLESPLAECLVSGAVRARGKILVDLVGDKLAFRAGTENLTTRSRDRMPRANRKKSA